MIYTDFLDFCQKNRNQQLFGRSTEVLNKSEFTKIMIHMKLYASPNGNSMSTGAKVKQRKCSARKSQCMYPKRDSNKTNIAHRRLLFWLLVSAGLVCARQWYRVELVVLVTAIVIVYVLYETAERALCDKYREVIRFCLFYSYVYAMCEAWVRLNRLKRLRCTGCSLLNIFIFFIYLFFLSI